MTHKLTWAGTAFVATLLAATAGHASAVTGELWINSPYVGNATIANALASGTPDATFDPGALNYQSGVGGYTIGGFLNNPTFSNESAAFVANGGAGANLNNTLFYFTGTIGLTAGANNFVVGHDDGLQLNIDGIGQVVNVPGPTSFADTPFTVDAPATGNYTFELAYGECCGAPADLLFSINNVVIGTPVPEPLSLSLLATGLLGLGGMRLRRKA